MYNTMGYNFDEYQMYITSIIFIVAVQNYVFNRILNILEQKSDTCRPNQRQLTVVQHRWCFEMSDKIFVGWRYDSSLTPRQVRDFCKDNKRQTLC